jgi:hypothetical protein
MTNYKVMDDAQLRNYHRLCFRIGIEPKPLQCIKSSKELKCKPQMAVKRKHE